MTIKLSKTRQELINTLKNRGLIVPDNNVALNIFTRLNYFQVINGLENILLDNSNPKRFTHTSINDFVSLYESNQKLSKVILSKLDSFEESLRSSIAYHFTRHNCYDINDTMQYTNVNKYRNISLEHNYPLMDEQYKQYINTFQAKLDPNNNRVWQYFILFQPGFLTKLINNNDYINLSFYQDNTYNAPNGVAVYRDSSHQNHQDVAVPFWVAIETLTFGQLLYLCHYLKNPEMKGVLNDFGFTFEERTLFLNSLDVLKELRNHLAHGNLVFRFSTPKHIKFNNVFVNYFELSPSSSGSSRNNTRRNYASVIYLYDTLKVLSRFENIKDVVKQIKKIFYINQKNIHNPAVNSKILQLMGAPSYQDLKHLNKIKF
ncbi:Abi family protein [Convivina intestini]|uniref:Abi family protein n=1 Tax=Convivina intestini TaxID=1505726 RepID=UPI00200C0EF1|nr:Abi family protein [Convivina intestini]CAH1856568.1 hypothetical protein R078131_01432 [Convivina intestini]